MLAAALSDDENFHRSNYIGTTIRLRLWFHFRPRPRLMPEVADTRKHHRESELIGGGDHFIIPHRPAGLCERRRASFRRECRPVREREQGLRHEDRSFERYA